MARILLIAPTCDGTDVGEAWVAYQWAMRLQERHDVTLLTYHKRDRPTAKSQLDSKMRVVEWSEPPLLGRAERLNSLLKPAYPVFHHRARRWTRRSLRAGETFDVAFQPTPVAMRYPSPAAGLGIPLFVGPVGGSLSDPPAFASENTAPWYTRLRALDAFRLRHDALLRRTYSNAACVLGIAPYVSELLADVPVRRFEVLSDVGLTSLPAPRPRLAHDGPLRLLFVGRVVRTKGARDAVRAVALLAREGRQVHLDVVGDGSDRRTCEAVAAAEQVTDRVTFHGSVPHAQVDAFYAAADVFVFPSYREAGGTVTFEAMGHGLPLVVCDRGGPGNAVDDTCAFALPVKTPDALAQGIADAIALLDDDPELRRRMGEHARTRVATVGMWDAKIRRFEELVAELVPTPMRQTP